MLHWETVTDNLKESLMLLMQANELKDFRLVGCTALSLQIGHRLSIDIELFTDVPFKSVDFDVIETFLRESFEYVSGDFGGNPGIGKTYLLGKNTSDIIKLDLFYSMDPFFQELVIEGNVKLASIEEIIAMKVDEVQRGGRKKDFWDLHELLENYQISKMISLHAQRFEWTHNEAKIRQNFINFSLADYDPDPICLKEKHWEFIKEDFEMALSLE